MNKKTVNKKDLKVEDIQFKGDAQRFFEYHNGNANPPPVSFEQEDDMSYYYDTINVDAISYIVKQRKWRLPELSSNLVQDIISRLRMNKSPDHIDVKNGGPVAVRFIIKYPNKSSQYSQYGVPVEELKGFQGKKKFFAPTIKFPQNNG